MIQSKPIANRLCKLGFHKVVCAQIDADFVHGVVNGGADDGVRVAVDACGGVAKDVQVSVVVEVEEPVGVALLDKDREGLLRRGLGGRRSDK